MVWRCAGFAGHKVARHQWDVLDGGNANSMQKMAATSVAILSSAEILFAVLDSSKRAARFGGVQFELETLAPVLGLPFIVLEFQVRSRPFCSSCDELF